MEGLGVVFFGQSDAVFLRVPIDQLRNVRVGERVHRYTGCEAFDYAFHADEYFAARAIQVVGNQNALSGN